MTSRPVCAAKGCVDPSDPVTCPSSTPAGRISCRPTPPVPCPRAWDLSRRGSLSGRSTRRHRGIRQLGARSARCRRHRRQCLSLSPGVARQDRYTHRRRLRQRRRNRRSLLRRGPRRDTSERSRCDVRLDPTGATRSTRTTNPRLICRQATGTTCPSASMRTGATASFGRAVRSHSIGLRRVETTITVQPDWRSVPSRRRPKSPTLESQDPIERFTANLRESAERRAAPRDRARLEQQRARDAAHAAAEHAAALDDARRELEQAIADARAARRAGASVAAADAAWRRASRDSSSWRLGRRPTGRTTPRRTTSTARAAICSRGVGA